MARRRSYSWYDNYYERSSPIETRDGIKAHSQHGKFGKNWWAKRWIEALEALVDSARLSRGRSYARRGQVLSIDETKNGIEARVQGSRRTPYKITIQVAALTDAQWEKVIDVLAEQALFTAQLLAGEMPQEIETAFQAAGVSLFPKRHSDLETHCSCPDWANPCKHVAATHYILGERFDEDPFLLFRLRGRTQDQILKALRQRRAAGMEAEEEPEEEEQVLPLEETLGQFWSLGASLDPVFVSLKEPPIEMPLLKRLGEPSFMPEGNLERLLAPAYRSASQTALAMAFRNAPGEEAEENEPG